MRARNGTRPVVIMHNYLAVFSLCLFQVLKFVFHINYRKEIYKVLFVISKK